MSSRLLLALLVLIPCLSFNIHENYKRLEDMQMEDLQQSMSCDTYECNPDNKTNPMPANLCVKPTQKGYYLQSCEKTEGKSSHCHINYPADGKPQYCEAHAAPHYHSWPGEDCIDDSECQFGYCNTTSARPRCVGSNHGESCSTSDECNPGLYCSEEGKCEPQLGAGQACTKLEQCENNLGCNVTTASGGLCVPFFSVPLGKYVSHCDQIGQYLCESSTCALTNLPTVGYCINPVKSIKSIPIECGADIDCVGQSGKHVMTSKCLCGMNPKGSAYCYPFLGDKPGVAFVSHWKKMFSKGENKVCNTMRRFTAECLHAIETTDAFNAYMDVLFINNYPFLQNNDACTKDTFTSFYWQADSPAILLPLLSLLLLTS